MQVCFIIARAPATYLEFEKESPVLFRANFESKKIDHLKFALDVAMLKYGQFEKVLSFYNKKNGNVLVAFKNYKLGLV